VVLKFAVSVALFGAAPAARIPSFESFIQLHKRSYQQGSDEYRVRRSQYERNRNSAEQQNKRSERLWTAGTNHLWDWTESEFKTLLGWDGSMRPEGSSSGEVRPHTNFLQSSDNMPNEKVWSNLTMANRVLDQGACGSCWAVASASALEGHVEIYTGVHRTFSIQQMVSCTPNPRHCGGDGGCKGATAELAMDWVLHNGIAEESEVPYTATDGVCTVTGNSSNMTQALQALRGKNAATAQTAKSSSHQSSAASFGMIGWETLPKNKYEPLLRALYERGPVAVSVAADAWGIYSAGIFNGCPKDATINHAVVSIGYGEEKSVKYWLIQNSWGSFWGEAGHIRLQRHDESGGYCGMNNDPQQGVACKGETTPVPVCGMCGVLFDSVVPHFSTTKAVVS